jgi:hypothetical protein
LPGGNSIAGDGSVGPVITGGSTIEEVAEVVAAGCWLFPLAIVATSPAGRARRRGARLEDDAPIETGVGNAKVAMTGATEGRTTWGRPNELAAERTAGMLPTTSVSAKNATPAPTAMARADCVPLTGAARMRTMRSRRPEDETPADAVNGRTGRSLRAASVVRHAA